MEVVQRRRQPGAATGGQDLNSLPALAVLTNGLQRHRSKSEQWYTALDSPCGYMPEPTRSQVSRVTRTKEVPEPEFRRDVEGFVDREAVEAVTIPGRRELPPVHNVIYSAFVDRAGGGGPDSMTMAVAHRLEGDGELQPIVLDLVREVHPPFSPAQVVKEFVEVLREYLVNVKRRSVRGNVVSALCRRPEVRWRMMSIATMTARRRRIAPGRLGPILAVALALMLPAPASAGTQLRFETVLGDVSVELFDTLRPVSVNNFLNYVDDDDYTDSIVHRSVPGFVIQGGGFFQVGGELFPIPPDPSFQDIPGHQQYLQECRY